MGNIINEQENSTKKSPVKQLDQSLFILNNSEIKSYKIYAISKLRPHQKTKINDIIDNFHRNGIPRKSDDFSVDNYIKFYPKEDPFFKSEEIELVHDHIKIYNENNSDKNKIQIYKGDLNIHGERHGLGKLITPYYELVGMWKNEKLNGWGRQSRCNGEVFEGRFVNGLLNGKGIFLNGKSNKYLGEFKDMKKWGKGKLLTDEIIYEGDFNNDKIEGRGKIKIFKSGIEYEGTFINDNIEGAGIFKFLNGDIYEGEVKNGKIHGNGVYKYRNGKIKRGLFEDGKLVNKKDLITSHNVVIDNQNVADKSNNEYLNVGKKIENETQKLENMIPDIQIDINEFKINKNLKVHQNNKYILKNVSQINKFHQYNNESNYIKSFQTLGADNNLIKYNYPVNIEEKKAINDTMEIKERDENPELMMSTYRNFGFGEQNYNNIY